MTPNIAVNITAKDKTEAGRKAAEKGFNAFARKTSAQASESGFAKIGKQLGGLTKFRSLDFGFGGIGHSLSTIGNVANDVGSGFGNATRAAVGFGSAGEGAMAAVAEGAGLAATAIAGTVAAVAGLAVGTYMLGEKWAKAGAEIDRTSKSVGMSARDLQSARAAGERFGVTADATTASIDGLGQAMYDVRSGANNIGVGVLAKYGKQLKVTKDGAVDTQQALMDVADIIAQQKDPYVQKKIAGIFGVSAMLPLLRQGSGAIKAAGADYQGSGAALSDAEITKSTDVFGKTVVLKQHLGAGEKTLGVAAEGATGAAADKMLGLTKELASGRPLTALTESVRGLAHSGLELAHSGLEAGRHLVEGGEKAAAKMIAGFEGFIDHAKWDRNAYRAGFGSDTVTDAATGQVSRVTPGTRVSRGAALLDLTRRVRSEFMPKVARSVGSEWDAFDDDTKAALTSVAYNYGHLPRNVLAAARSGDTNAIASAIRDHESDNGGINARRRDAEADAVGGAAKAHVEITLKGAPPGTVARVTPAPGVAASLNFQRGMDGP